MEIEMEVKRENLAGVELALSLRAAQVTT